MTRWAQQACWVAGDSRKRGRRGPQCGESNKNVTGAKKAIVEDDLAAALASDDADREKEPSGSGRKASFSRGSSGGLKLSHSQVQEDGRLREEKSADVEGGVADAALNFLEGWVF